jgi:hypothetical protein
MIFILAIEKRRPLVQFLSMTRLLIGLGIFLIAWGAFVLVTGDFVATLDIAAGLIASGIGVIGLSAVVKALNRIAENLSERNMLAVQAPAPLPAARPAERPRPPGPAVQAEPPPAPERRPQVEPERRPPQAEPEPRAKAPEPSEPRRREAPAAEGPKLIREGIIEGEHYRFYDDGSIEAEGPRGIRRFRSIDEAREQITRERSETPQTPKPAPANPPAGDRRPPDERAPRMLAEAPAAKPPEQDLTWDAYLSGGRKPEGEAAARTPEDDQWSEPFRMLLRGDAPPPPDTKPSKR